MWGSTQLRFVAGMAAKANGKVSGAGQLATPYREMASGQRDPRKTALAEWFETDVHEGSRNHALARGVGLMAAAGTPMAVAQAAANGWCRHRCSPPLVGQEVGRTFDSIFKAEARKRITEPDDAADTLSLIVHGMHEFTALTIPPRRHVLRPVLPEKGLAMLFAPRGVGKTYVALGMAYAIATAKADEGCGRSLPHQGLEVLHAIGPCRHRLRA